MKATGTGIGHDLQALEFKINTEEFSPQVCYYNRTTTFVLITCCQPDTCPTPS